MSSRNLRRLKEQRERERKKREEKENEEPTEEFSPHFVQMNPAYKGLEVSSGSESDLSTLSDHIDQAEQSDEAEQPDQLGEPDEPDKPEQYQDEAAAVIPEEDKYGAKKKTYTVAETEKKNKKNKHKNKKNAKKPAKMDEVEWSLREVNRILGTPPKRVEEEVVDPMVKMQKTIFSIHPNQINVNYELAKVFGEEERLRKARTGTRRMRHEIGLSPDVHPFRVKGLMMTRYKTEGDIKFFKFEHTQDYRSRCHNLVQQLRTMLVGQMSHQRNLHSENCVEALLENCDFLYYLEEHKGANQALEQAIYFMQSVGDASFNFVDGKTRLEYEFVENRPFHIAVLKYLHVLTNIACHRTALELAKVLLNLDPTDPLAVIFIIDTLAIRAREHQWLLDLIEVWREKRQAQRLFHMRYSRALAMFHVACKKKDYDGVDASKVALTKAIKLFPLVAVKIMEYSKMAIPDDLKKHELLMPQLNAPSSPVLDELMTLYAWLIGPRWREPRVWNWFMDTLTDITDVYDRSPELREEVMQHARLRSVLYRKIPLQMKRHLYAIRPMSKYISDGRMPHTNPSVSFNPFPSEGPSIDTYQYFTNWLQQSPPPENAIMALIQGIYPEMYQIGTRNLGEMLERMDGMEIRSNYGSYLIVGPSVYEPAQRDGYRIYRVVFIRLRDGDQPAINPGRPDPEGQPQNQQQPVLLNGDLHLQEDDDIPLMNRLDINGIPNGYPDDVDGLPNGHVDDDGLPNGYPDDVDGLPNGHVDDDGLPNGYPDDVDGLPNGHVDDDGIPNGYPDDVDGLPNGHVDDDGIPNGYPDDVDGLPNGHLENGDDIPNGHPDDDDDLPNGFDEDGIYRNWDPEERNDLPTWYPDYNNGGQPLRQPDNNGPPDERPAHNNFPPNVRPGSAHNNGPPNVHPEEPEDPDRPDH